MQDIGGPHGYPREAGIRVHGGMTRESRTHDHYYACTGKVKSGLDTLVECKFWTYDERKSNKHAVKRQHIVRLCMLDVDDVPPAIRR